MNRYANYLVEWIQEQVKSANAIGVVVGVSGGVDSALVAALAKKAFPNNTLGLIMPIDNMYHYLNYAQQVVDQLEIEHKIVNLTEVNNTLESALQIDSKIANANIKPRLRMITLYAHAQDKKYLVLGTDNACEWHLGYFTKYGDGGVDLLPIVHLTKAQVRKMATIMNINDEIVNQAPSAGLWEGQTDEKELGITYQDVDDLLDGKRISQEAKQKITSWHERSNHKRNPAPKPQLKPIDMI